MDPKRLFRQAALEKLSSPERLDVMMRVTSPAAWLALTAVGVLLALVLLWSVVGTISIKVRGQGILFRGEAVLDVTAGIPGRVADVLVVEGQTVAEGDVIVRLRNPELDETIASKREELARLTRQAEENAARQERIIREKQAQAAEVRAKVSRQEDAVRRGLLTAGQLLRTKQELTALEQGISGIRKGLDEERNRIDQVRDELAELERRARADVRTPYAGRVTEVTVKKGTPLRKGQLVAILEDLEKPIEAKVFIPVGEGKKVRPGMPVQISPSTVKVEEWGFILGRVKSVSEFPVTPQGLRKVLNNEQLVASLTGRSAPIQVVVELLEDPATESGFRWSSSKGPPEKVYSGTVCVANVTVDKKRPISYVLPIFRRALGAS